MDKDKLKDLKELLMLAQGGDPDAQSLLQELLRVEHIQEKTNFPTAINQQKQTYLKMAEKFYEDEPEIAGLFGEMAEWDAITWRSYKGFNYEGNVEMLKRGTDLSGVIMQPQLPGVAPQPEKKRFWQRNKPQGEQLSE